MNNEKNPTNMNKFNPIDTRFPSNIVIKGEDNNLEDSESEIEGFFNLFFKYI